MTADAFAGVVGVGRGRPLPGAARLRQWERSEALSDRVVSGIRDRVMDRARRLLEDPLLEDPDVVDRAVCVAWSEVVVRRFDSEPRKHLKALLSGRDNQLLDRLWLRAEAWSYSHWQELFDCDAVTVRPEMSADDLADVMAERLGAV